MKTQLIYPTILSILMLCLGGTAVAAEPSGGNFNVRDFGAVGDGKTLDSPAIDRAIDAAAAAGGGTVVIPAGIYLSGSIHLKSNIHLVIGTGATILGAPQSMGVYDETESYTLGGYQDGGHCYFHNSLIWGENLTNVSITGDGTINGGGLVSEDRILDDMVGFNHLNPPVTTNAPPVSIHPSPPMPRRSAWATRPSRSSFAKMFSSATSRSITAGILRSSSPAATT
jgi:polygalacturonase